jgi:hypothetical protein
MGLLLLLRIRVQVYATKICCWRYEVAQFGNYTIQFKVGYKGEILRVLKEALSNVAHLQVGNRSMIAGEFRIQELSFWSCTDEVTSYWWGLKWGWLEVVLISWEIRYKVIVNFTRRLQISWFFGFELLLNGTYAWRFLLSSWPTSSMLLFDLLLYI